MPAKNVLVSAELEKGAAKRISIDQSNADRSKDQQGSMASMASPVPVTPTTSVAPDDMGALHNSTRRVGGGVDDSFCAISLATAQPNTVTIRSASPCRPFSRTPPPPVDSTENDDGFEEDEGPVVLSTKKNREKTLTTAATQPAPPGHDLTSVTRRKTMKSKDAAPSPPARVLVTVEATTTDEEEVMGGFGARSPTPLVTDDGRTDPLSGTLNAFNPQRNHSSSDPTLNGPASPTAGPISFSSPAINVSGVVNPPSADALASEITTTRRAMTSLTVHRSDANNSRSMNDEGGDRSAVGPSSAVHYLAGEGSPSSANIPRNVPTGANNNNNNNTVTKKSSSSATSAAHDPHTQPASVRSPSSSAFGSGLPAAASVAATAPSFSFSSPSPIPRGTAGQFSPPPPLNGRQGAATAAAGSIGTSSGGLSAPPRRSRSPEREQKGQHHPSTDAKTTTITTQAAESTRSDDGSFGSVRKTQSFFASPSPPPTPAILKDIERHVQKVLQKAQPPTQRSDATTVAANTVGGSDAAEEEDSSANQQMLSNNRRSLSPSRPTSDVPPLATVNGGVGDRGEGIVVPRSLSPPRKASNTSSTPPPTRRSASPSRIDRVLRGGAKRNNGNDDEEEGLRNALEFGMKSPTSTQREGNVEASLGSIRGSHSSGSSLDNTVAEEEDVRTEQSLLADGGGGGGFAEPSPPPLVSSSAASLLTVVARGPTIITARADDDGEDGPEGSNNDPEPLVGRNKKKLGGTTTLTSPSPAPAPARSAALLRSGTVGSSSNTIIRKTAITPTAEAETMAGVSQRENTTATSLGQASDSEGGTNTIYTREEEEEGKDLFTGGGVNGKKKLSSLARLGASSHASVADGDSPDVTTRFLAKHHANDQKKAAPHQLVDLEDTFAGASVGVGDGQQNNAATVLLNEVSGEPLGKKAMKRAQRMQNKELAKAKYKAGAAVSTASNGGGKGMLAEGRHIRSFFNNVLVNKERAAIEKRFLDEIMAKESNGRFIEHDGGELGNSRQQRSPSAQSTTTTTDSLSFTDKVAMYFISNPFLLWLVSTRRGVTLILACQTVFILLLHAIFAEVVSVAEIH